MFRETYVKIYYIDVSYIISNLIYLDHSEYALTGGWVLVTASGGK